ncbi:hypothetical protein CCAX7_35930 [Capsulimonas corticalis]|uniref:DUF2382 domain-containing protein n=1 Tax=Capsulimonas corticalis TaxID=2219043 RepID=A0A402D779_9BACT|nr:YsnF/AvaK domain-containing protein [Capsulimonas corticalis]BDI31542.1 hypothetical protein CCAX7_35930 [Capsulimonas corticalis]
MASTVVGLFEQRSDAEAALNDLVNNGFSRSTIDLKTPSNDAGADFDALINELEEESVPKDDARLFAEGVRSGDTLEIARVDDDRATLAQEIMNQHGALDIHDAFAQRSSVLPAAEVGAAGIGAASLLGASAERVVAPKTGASSQDETVIPVIEEELAVGKRQIQRGGVRVFQRVEERPVNEQVTLHEEHVSVQRNPVDRPVTSADTAFQAETLEVTSIKEVPVVSKEARVVEEVIVGKTATDRIETVHDTVRRTEVEVEDLTNGATTRDRI